MAKIRIIGNSELIQVPNNDLENFVNGRLNKTIKDDAYVQLGSWGGQAKEVKSWVLDEEIKPDENEAIRKEEFFKYLEGRKKLIALSPAERAEENFEYIRLVYKIFTGRELKTEQPHIQKDLLNLAEKWFEANPLWSKPSLKVFREYLDSLLKQPKEGLESQVLEAMLKLLENIEISERQAVDFDKGKVEEYEKTADGLDYLIGGAEEPAF